MNVCHKFIFWVVLTIFIILICSFTNEHAFAASIGNNYEQQIPIEGVQLPSVRIETELTVNEGDIIDVTAFATIDTQNGAQAFYYWYADKGNFQMHTSYPDYSTVKFQAPEYSCEVTIAAQVGDGLGYIATDRQTIIVGNGNQPPDDLPVEPGIPDLIIENPEAEPNLIQAGDTIVVRSRIRNIGTQISPSCKMGYYLSLNDSILDNSDIQLRSENVSILQVNSTHIHEFAVNTPQDIAFGTYYLIFQVDDQNTVVEKNEANNSATVRIEIREKPDLEFTNYSVPGTANADEMISVRVDIINSGSLSTSGSSKVGYYFSLNNSDWDSNDIYLNTSYLGDLIPGASQTFNREIRIPPAAKGNCSIIFYADHTNLIKESNEDNNILSVPILINPVNPGGQDLVVERAVLESPSLNAGEVFDVGYTMKNIGTEHMGSTKIGFYFSLNDQLDNEDLFKEERYVDGLDAGESIHYNNDRLSIPSNILPGEYYILFVADYKQTWLESNENNNILAIPVQVTAPDLKPVQFEIHPVDGIPILGKLDVIVSIKNVGNGISNRTEVDFFISDNDQYDADSDECISGDSIQLILPNSSFIFEDQFAIPRSISTGNKYLICLIDRYDSSKESNESNNIIYVPITILSQNNIPVLSANPDVSITKNQLYFLSTTFTDPDTDEQHTVAIDWGDGSILYYGQIDQITHSITGSHVFEEAGEYTVSLTIEDKHGDKSSNTFLATVKEPVPESINRTLTIEEDQTERFRLNANHPENNPLVYRIVKQGNKGLANIIDPDVGICQYEPYANVFGEDVFTFKVNDGKFDSNVAEVRITITPVNDLPLAKGVNLSTERNIPVPFNLSGFDVDNDIVFTIVKNPLKGQVQLIDSKVGSCKYTPDPNVSGNDSFSFQVSDGQSSSNIAVVYISIGCMKGDEDNDGEITAKDAVNTFHLSFKTSWSSNELCKSDYDGDGEVTAQDAVLIFWAYFEN
ncbi:secreted protein containing APHP domain protein [Candidatus Magnetomorum sp. HK-1]|nr:secreted protein containing APHP domain protein [Candidatus Magnetomorum sp. HK-1]